MILLFFNACLLISDSKHALAAIQAAQRCNANVSLVHATRRMLRRLCGSKKVALGNKASHSGNPWNELVDSLATAAMHGSYLPRTDYWTAPWYHGFAEFDPVPVLSPLLPFVAPKRTDPRTWYNGPRRKPNIAAMRRFATFNALTLSPAELRKSSGGLRVSARQALLAKGFFEVGFDASFDPFGDQTETGVLCFSQ